MPEVTVLIAARNAAETLPAVLRSVQRSRGVDWQCVIVDDHSADETKSIAEACAAGDSRVRLLQMLGPNRGVVDARNFGLAAITSPFVAILDADDIMHRDRLRLQLKKMRDDNLDAVGCHVRYFPRKELGAGRLKYETWLNKMQSSTDLHAAAFIEMPLGHPTMMLRMSKLKEVGLYQDNAWPEDWDLFLRLHHASAKMGVVTRALHAWRLRDDSLSQTSGHYSIEAFTRCRAHYLATQFNLKKYILWGYGDTGRALCRALAKLDCQPIAIVELHPGRIGQTIQGAPVIAPENLRDTYFAAKETCPDFPPVLFSVAGPKARDLMSKSAKQMSLRHLDDYIYCA